VAAFYAIRARSCVAQLTRGKAFYGYGAMKPIKSQIPIMIAEMTITATSIVSHRGTRFTGSSSAATHRFSSIGPLGASLDHERWTGTLPSRNGVRSSNG
jgi:hypothetical protein